ncbi:MAG: NifU family protein [Flavobacteriaceae bacterium]|nr:NifU family protein [Flavobacteriaceae bacterium]
MNNMKINIQNTSNPLIIKFVANSFLVNYNNYEFNNIDEASDSPLAQELFHLPFVKKIYISGNFIAIERFNIVEWEDVQNEVASQIENYLNSGKTVVSDSNSRKTPISIYAESTPNPAVLKFVCNKALVNTIYEYNSIEEAKDSPLATKLFHFPFVKAVFFDANFISITKFDIAEWNDITTNLREFIKQFLEEGNPVLMAQATTTKEENEQLQEEVFETYDDTSKEIINILEEYVKPAVASDGGNIQFKSYDKDSKVVKVILQGACSGCPSSTFTLKNGIENMLKQMLHGKVEYVEAING